MKRIKNIIQYIAAALAILIGGLVFWKHGPTINQRNDQADKDKKPGEKAQSVNEWLDLKNNPYAPLIIGCGGFLNLPQHAATTTTVNQNQVPDSANQSAK